MNLTDDSYGCLDDITMEECYVFHLLCFYHFGVLGHNRRRLGGTPSLHETQEGLCGLENVTRASMEIGVGRKRVKFQFNVNHPLKMKH